MCVVVFVCVCSSVKVHARTSASFTRGVEEGQQRILGHFVTPPQLVNLSTPLDVGAIAANLNTQIEHFNSKGSGWQFDHIVRFEFVITEYRPLCGGSSSYVETPKIIADKHCIINVKNDQEGDEKCFLYSVLSCILYDRITKKPKPTLSLQRSRKVTQGRRYDFSRSSKRHSHF